MVAILVLPILVLLIAGFLSLIVFAIARKKWALLFIPLGLVAVLAVVAFVGYFYAVPTVAEYKDNYPYSTVEHHANNTSNVRQYGVEVSRSNDSRKDVRTIHVNSKNGNSVLVSKQNGNSTVHVNSRYGSVEVIRKQPLIQIRRMAGFLLPVILMGLLALVVLVVIAIIRKKWALLFIPLGVAALAVLGFFNVRLGHMSERSEQIAEAEYPTMVENVPDKPLPAVWSPGMETEFISDNYYSIPSALRGLAVRAEKKFVHGDQFPKKIAFITYKDDFDENVLAKAVSFFQQLLPKTEFVLLSAGIDSIEGYDDRIALSVTYTIRPQNTVAVGGPDNIMIVNNAPASGKIRMDTYSITHYSPSFVVGFQEKPWLESIDAYSNARPGNHYQIAYSQNPAGSWGSAIAQVESQAMQIVAERVSQVARSLPQYDGRAANYSISRDDLWDYGLVEDQFGQSLTGNASNISRQAILLNLLPQNVQRLAENKLGIHKAAKQSWAYHIMSAIGIALVICVIYLILNAATKGYYTVVLRILTVIGIIAVVLLLTMV